MWIEIYSDVKDYNWECLTILLFVYFQIFSKTVRSKYCLRSWYQRGRLLKRVAINYMRYVEIKSTQKCLQTNQHREGKMYRKALFHYSLRMKATNLSENTKDDNEESESLSLDFYLNILQESMLENEVSDTERHNMEMVWFSRELGSAICTIEDWCDISGHDLVWLLIWKTITRILYTSYLHPNSIITKRHGFWHITKWWIHLISIVSGGYEEMYKKTFCT